MFYYISFSVRYMYFRGVSGRWNKCFLDDEMRSKKGIMDIKNEDLCYILLRLNICFIVCCVANGNVALNAWEMLEKGCNE